MTSSPYSHYSPYRSKLGTSLAPRSSSRLESDLAKDLGKGQMAAGYGGGALGALLGAGLGAGIGGITAPQGKKLRNLLIGAGIGGVGGGALGGLGGYYGSLKLPGGSFTFADTDRANTDGYNPFDNEGNGPTTTRNINLANLLGMDFPGPTNSNDLAIANALNLDYAGAPGHVPNTGADLLTKLRFLINNGDGFRLDPQK